MKKYIWACILLAVVFYCIAEQSGAITSIRDNWSTGKTQATFEGWKR